MFRVSARAGVELPSAPVSPADLAFKAAELVANHDALDADLLRALLDLRPRKRAELQALANAAGLPLPPPPPVPVHTRAVALYAALAAVCFATLFAFAPERLPAYKLAMVAVSTALMAGLVSLVLTGQLLVRLSPAPRPWHPVAEASGGLAVVLLVLVWWPQPALQPAPPASSTPTEPLPNPQPNQSPGPSPGGSDPRRQVVPILVATKAADRPPAPARGAAQGAEPPQERRASGPR